MGPSSSSSVAPMPVPQAGLRAYSCGPPPAYEDVPMRPLRPGRYPRQLSVEDIDRSSIASPRSVSQPAQLARLGAQRNFDQRWLCLYIITPMATAMAYGIISGLRKGAAQQQMTCLLGACAQLSAVKAEALFGIITQPRVGWPQACQVQSDLLVWAESGLPFGPCPGYPALNAKQGSAVGGVMVGTFVLCTAVVLHQISVVKRHNAHLTLRAQVQLQAQL